jgi:hypothetical protein
MIVFFYLGYAQFRNSRTALRKFRIREPALDEGSEDVARAAAVIDKFVEDFNKYLDILSGNMRTQYLIASGTYFLAGIASMVSWILSFIPL